MSINTKIHRTRLTWFVAVVLLALVVYQVYSGLALKKVGIPGVFEVEFADQPEHQLVDTLPAIGPSANVPSECDITNAWDILQAHRGSITDAIDDCLVFEMLVLDLGCLQHPYTLDLMGKQNLNRYVITVTSEYAVQATPDVTYHYKEYQTSLDVGGELSHVSSKARRVAGSDDPWEVLD